MVSASSSSNVDGRWVARGHTGSKRIDGEAVQYGRGLSTTLVWDAWRLTVALRDLKMAGCFHGQSDREVEKDAWVW